MSEAEPLLSTLCSICNIHPHAYRCPRCSTLTCSLTCVKRHKTWAQCSGQRDHGAYVKMADLATPAGIDRDYNYLTSIEREFDVAEKRLNSKGVVLRETIRPKNQQCKGEANLKAGLAKSGAIVARAPKGMSRSNTNATQWSKTFQCLEWTVEWIHPNGDKRLAQCKEVDPISKIYQVIRETKPHRKRKRTAKCNDFGLTIKDSHATNNGNTSGSHQVDGNHAQAVEAGQIDKTLLYGTRKNGNRSKHQLHAAVPDSAQNTDVVETSPQSRDEQDTYFYLHIPSLPSRQTVVTPLASEATLSMSLRQRVVLEYPTIYVLEQESGDTLPERFITEDKYYKMARKGMIEELEEGEIEEPKSKSVPQERSGVGKLDKEKLIEVLSMDLGDKR